VEESAFLQAVQLFFKEHWTRCHGAEKQKGDFRIDTLEANFADLSTAERCSEVLFRMSAGEMSPKKEQQPKPAELGGVADSIAGRMREGEAARMAKRGVVAHYRLSRGPCDLLR